MPKKNALECVWMTLVEVEAEQENTEFGKGEKAFVNAFVRARNAELAEAKTVQALDRLEFHTISFENTRKWGVGTLGPNRDRALGRLARLAQSTGEVQFSVFHSWDGQG